MTATPQPVASSPPAAPAKPGHRLNVALLVTLGILAFFLATFPVRTSDFWGHMAAGRYLARGLGNLGTDPFTIAGPSWVHSSWLFDLGLYGVHALLGDVGLVIVKGLLTIALAGILLLLAQPVLGLKTAVVCVALALVTLSTRLFVSPAAFSLLLLALTLWLLWREPVEPQRWWWLPPLFLLWANLDSWFILGPLLVLLAYLGEWLQRPRGQGPADPVRHRTLGRVFLVGLLACLVNPFTYRVFILPPEPAWLLLPLEGFFPPGMLAGGLGLRDLSLHDASFVQGLALWHSPFSPDYLSPQRGLNVSGLAYFVLLVLGVLSFVVAGRAGQLSWPRLLVFVVVAGLSAGQARLIPLFAVAAGPIAALNFGTARRPDQPKPRGTRLLGGALLAALVALLVLNWPGWLHSRFGETRSSHRVGFEIQADPSLQQTAEQLERWAQEGRVRHVLNLSPDLGSYCAWFAPSVKYAFDYRFALLGERAATLSQLRSQLRPKLAQNEREPSLHQTAALLEAWQVDQVAFSGTDGDPQGRAGVMRLLIQGAPWSLTYADGRSALFSFGPGQARLAPVPALDFNALAFAPRAQQGGNSSESGTESGGYPTDSWSLFWRGEPPLSLSARQGDFYATCHSLLSDRSRLLHMVFRPQDKRDAIPPPLAAHLFAPGLIASAPGHGGGLAAVAAVADMEWSRQLTTPTRLVSPGLPLLALRSARQALRENSADQQAWRVLEQAYACLRTQEGFWLGRDPLTIQSKYQELRRQQWTGAILTLLHFQPDNFDLHRVLARLYGEAQLYDAALEHATRARDLIAQVAGPVAALPQFDMLKKEVGALQKGLAQQVRVRRDYFDGEAARLNLAGKVKLAILEPMKTGNPREPFVPPGLALLTLELIRGEDLSQLNEAERRFCTEAQLRILLALGRGHEAAAILQQADLPKLLGPNFLLFQFQAAALLGDQRAFDHALQTLDWLALSRRSVEMLQTIVRILPPGPQILGNLTEMAIRHRELEQFILDSAEHSLLRGMVALDAGDIPHAERMLRQFLRLLPPGADHPERQLAFEYLRWIEKYKR